MSDSADRPARFFGVDRPARRTIPRAAVAVAVVLGQVEDQVLDIRADLAQPQHGTFTSGGVLVQQDHRGACRDEAPRGLEAEAAGTAGDDDRAPGKIHSTQHIRGRRLRSEGHRQPPNDCMHVEHNH